MNGAPYWIMDESVPASPSCPVCKTAAEQRWLLTSQYWHCVTCKDDIEAIRARQPKPDPTPKLTWKQYGVSLGSISELEYQEIKKRQEQLERQMLADMAKLTWGPHGPVTKVDPV
jgi:hypothetical protein